MITDLGKLHPDLEGIFLIEGVGLTSNVYLILGARITIIDTGSGPPNNPIIPNFERCEIDAKKVNNIIITHSHYDHTGGLVEFASFNDITVRVHPRGEEFIPLSLKITPLRDDETLKAGHLTLKVIYTPGHSSDSLCLYNPAYQILLSGDTVFPNGNFGRTDLPSGDERELFESLKKLSELPVKHLLAGHEKPVIGEGQTHLSASLKAASSLLAE